MNSIREQIKSMLTVQPRPGGFTAAFKLAADLSILPDHFSNAPILPGVCLVQAVLIGGAIAQGHTNLRLTKLKNAKLMHPIRPGDQVHIEAETTVDPTGQIGIKAKVTGGEKRCAEISLLAIPDVPQEVAAA